MHFPRIIVYEQDGSLARLLRPFKISLEDGKGQGSVLVTFHEIIPNQPINASELGHV